MRRRPIPRPSAVDHGFAEDDSQLGRPVSRVPPLFHIEDWALLPRPPRQENTSDRHFDTRPAESGPFEDEPVDKAFFEDDMEDFTFSSNGTESSETTPARSDPRSTLRRTLRPKIAALPKRATAQDRDSTALVQKAKNSALLEPRAPVIAPRSRMASDSLKESGVASISPEVPKISFADNLKAAPTEPAKSSAVYKGKEQNAPAKDRSFLNAYIDESRTCGPTTNEAASVVGKDESEWLDFAQLELEGDEKWGDPLADPNYASLVSLIENVSKKLNAVTASSDIRAMNDAKQSAFSWLVEHELLFSKLSAAAQTEFLLLHQKELDQVRLSIMHLYSKK